jgi:hypothetical protein
MKNTILFFILSTFISSACGTAATRTSQIQTSTPLTTTHSSNTPVLSTQLPLWHPFKNNKYGYSLDYPSIYNVIVVSDERVEVGDQIVVDVSNRDPATLHGDGPLIENIANVQISGYPAKLFTGYIGSVGGYTPQRIRRYIVKWNGTYFVITFYALGLHVGGDVSQIAQFNPDDIILFDKLVASIKIP